MVIEKQCEDCGEKVMENWFLCASCHIHRIDAASHFNQLVDKGIINRSGQRL